MQTAGVPMLRESRINFIEFARQAHHVVPEDGTAFSDILKDEYWSLVGHKFKPGDIVEIHAEDGSYFAELYVRAAGRNWAKMALLRKVDLEPVAIALGSPEFEAAWKGPHRKFSVVRLSDNQIIKDSFDTREQAIDYIKSHVKAMAA